ncbi:MAG: DUF2207 domain-containing protein [Oscillospiraceae bacterium]|nr:DUF2207 domain-containing protein [Oscillospiraceae bacterium]
MRIFKWFTLGIIVAIVAGIFVMCVPNEDGDYIWNPFDYAKITEVDYKAVVVDEPGSDGKIVVTERLTFDIHAFSKDNLFWELWRDLSEDYIDGVKVEYKVISVKQIFDDGREPVVFTESPKLYWDDSDFTSTARGYGPGKWFHSGGPYSESRRQYECVFFYVDGLYREEVAFEIVYEMYNAALRWADSSELYISLFSEKDVNHLKSFKGQILFPNEKMPRTGNYYANTYGTNSHTFPFVESATVNPGYHTFSFKLNEPQLKFRRYNEYIEFALVSFGDDKHIFTQYSSSNNYYDDDMLDELRKEQADYEALPGRFKAIKIITLLLFFAGAFLTVILVFAFNERTKKKHVFYQPSMQMDYFRDIPSELDPNFASELTFCKHKSRQDIQDGYAAVMLSLTCKGYIELNKVNNNRDWDSGNVDIIVKYKPMQSQPDVDADGLAQNYPLEYAPNYGQIKPLTLSEEQYFNLILRHSDGLKIPLNLFQIKISEDYEHTNLFVKIIKNAITNIGVSQGYYQKVEYKKPKEQAKGWVRTLGTFGALLLTAGNLISYQTRLDLAFGAFTVLGIGFVASGILLDKLFKKYVLLTQFGEDEYAKWRGLYNFLNSETLMNERTVVELPIWENYLIYATAFGISEKVIKALEIRCPNADESPVLRGNSYYRSRGFRTFGHSFRSATRTASYTARSGGHGGYGGGGRGGGGGGGGH